MARKQRQRSKAQRRYHIAELAGRVIDKHVPVGQRPLVRLQAAWPRIAPPALRARAWPADLHRDELMIHVCDSQWAHELTYLKHDLLDRIGQVCPEAGARSIRVRIGEIPSDAEPPTAVPVANTPPRPSLGLEPPVETVDAMEGVADDALRRAIATARIALGSARG